MGRLVVVSNRIAPPDDKKASAGGLAVGVLGALKAAGGLWFGWSGEISNDEKPLKKVSRGNITWASFALSEKDYDEYYSEFSNAVLWPAFHYRLDLVKFQRESYEGYMRVNALLADKLLPLIEEDDILWIHDYHLLPFARELRKRGVKNRIGFFRPRRSLRRCRSMMKFLKHCLITTCSVSRRKMTGWRSSTACRVKPGWSLTAANLTPRGDEISIPKSTRLVLSQTKSPSRPLVRCRRSLPSSRTNSSTLRISFRLNDWIIPKGCRSDSSLMKPCWINSRSITARSAIPR